MCQTNPIENIVNYVGVFYKPRRITHTLLTNIYVREYNIQKQTGVLL
jgi:hypothetical protein